VRQGPGRRPATRRTVGFALGCLLTALTALAVGATARQPPGQTSTATPSPPPPAPAAVPEVEGGAATGVPAGTALRPYYGNLTITEAGAVYDALDVHGFVTVLAPDVRISRSVIRGGRATSNRGLIVNNAPEATGLLVEDTELVPEYPSVWLDGIVGFNFTARRIDAHGTVDTAKVYGDNVRIEDSWLHDMTSFPSDPDQGGGPTHNDGVQVLGGRNIRITGNSISGASNAAVQITQDVSATSDLVLADNRLDGGGCTVNVAHKVLKTMTGITVSGNRFGRGTRIADCAIIASAMTDLTAAGNVWDDSGEPVRIRRG